MTIAEIESTLNALRTRHPNLDEEMLITLLTAGGWEDKFIKETLVLFRSSKQSNPVVASAPTVLVVPKTETAVTSPINTISTTTEVSKTTHTSMSERLETLVVAEGVTKSEASHVVSENNTHENNSIQTAGITYYNGTGEEEGELKAFSEQGEVSKVEMPKKAETHVSSEQKIEQQVAYQEIKIAEDLPFSREKEIEKTVEPQSLIMPKTETGVPGYLQPGHVSAGSEIEPPENLPLKPFESAPHVWPFSKYKDVFHGETMPVLPPDEQVLVAGPSQEHHLKKIKIKRTGFDGEDEGLIFLTGTTLLIILLLLAYMYSNGRL